MPGPFPATDRFWLAALLCGLAAAGCGAAASTATPVTGAAPKGSPTTTAFVSPYSYEWFVRAELLAARGEYAAAAAAYDAALSSADDDPYLLSRMADALDRAGDLAGATHALDSALAIDPRSEAAWLERGRSAARHGNVADAYAAYERAENAADGSTEAPLELAELLRQQGSRERGLAVLERLAARTDHGSAAALAARLELARARGDGAALALAVRAALARGGAHGPRFAALASELAAADQHALALRVLAALPESERDPRLELELRLALLERSEVELLLATTPPAALGGPLAVADAYLQIGRYERALAALDETDGHDDPNRRSLLLGRALLDSGQAGRAALELARVPRDSSHFGAARRALKTALEAAGLPSLAGESAEPASQLTETKK